jgi:TrmH family RNA methyltransferase
MRIPEQRNVGKLIRDLRRRKATARRGAVIAEGRRLVEDVLASGAGVLGVLVADDVVSTGAAELVGAAEQRRIAVEVLPRREFDALADTATPSGVLAAVAWAPCPLDALPPPPAPPARAALLVLDGVQDPGNVGTMLRTAHTLGAWATVALDGTADLRNPKVVRGAMGAHFRHPVVETDFGTFLAFAQERGVALCLAVQDGAPLPDVRLAEPRVALVVGSEGRGVRAGWSALPVRRVTIPMQPGAESLNAAVAAGILLYELLRAAA